MKDSIWTMIETHLSDLVQNFTAAEDIEDWDLPALYNAVRTITPLPASLTSSSWNNMEPEDIEEQILDIAEKNYEQMETVLGEEAVRRHEKQLMLQIVSTLWVRHLTALDDLRQGIGLRAFGQQDPLVAFKKDAFEMFGQLRDAIQEETVRRIYHPTIQVEAPRPQKLQAEHPDAIAASRQQAETPGATKKAPEPIRVEKTLGRNDPCHCGSGKKYKHCHMKSDLAGGNGKNAKTPAQTNQAKQGGKKRRARARRR
jgi:preprotein translocase subunit SecA